VAYNLLFRFEFSNNPAGSDERVGVTDQPMPRHGSRKKDLCSVRAVREPA